MTKYEKFCNELKKFCFKINITTPILFKEETEENILQFEKNHNLRIPEGYRTVLKFTGQSFLFYDNISLDINNSIGNIESCIKINTEKKFLKNVNKLDSALNQILPVAYTYNGSVMSFIRLDEENPLIYTYYGDDDDGELDDDDLIIGSTWINFIRRIVFRELQHKYFHIANPIVNNTFDNDKNDILYSNSLCLNIDKIPWSNEYINYYMNNRGLLWEGSRERFEHIATEIEKKEDRILGINEFEWMFIDYLKEKGKL